MPKPPLASFLSQWNEDPPTFSKCEKESCHQPGTHPAPKPNRQTREYHYFCFEHVQAYNESWNYYQGMSDTQIEHSRKADLTWDRPTWPLRRRISKHQLKWTSPSRTSQKREASHPAPPPLSVDICHALKVFKLSLTFTSEELKKRYRTLVKTYHPDLQSNPRISKEAETHIKRINQAYSILKQLSYQTT